MKGKECILSAQDIDPRAYDDGVPKEVKILNTYKNCKFHSVRILEEREKLFWGIDYRRIDQQRKKR